MKKLFLSAFVALFAFASSAQFMVVTTYDNDQDETADKITANMGIGYMVNDAFTVGLKKHSHDHADDADSDGHDHADDHADDEDTYDLWVRYNLSSYIDGGYLALEMPTEDGSDNMKIGLGMAFNVWNGLYVEPNYMMYVDEEAAGDGDRGTFNIGVSYRF